MSVKIEAISFHSGAPAWSDSYRYPGYRITGSGFGTRPGIVTIDGDAQRVVHWSPDSIMIAKPGRDPFWNPARAPVFEVTTAKACRVAANDASYVLVAA